MDWYVKFCGQVSWTMVTQATGITLEGVRLEQLLGGWAVMVAVMMPPLLAMPLNHVVASTLRRKRPLAIATVCGAYFLAWIWAGAVLVPLAMAMSIAYGDWAPIVSLVAALLWSMSPLAQRAHNRSHRLFRIGLGTCAVVRDCIAQGGSYGMWCIVACWPWMIMMSVSTGWHALVMLLTTAFLVFDRMLPAAPPRWHLPQSLLLADARHGVQKVVGNR